MFDVDWSDPNRESVGDRRTRKQKEKGSGGDGHSENGEAATSQDGGNDQGVHEGRRDSGSVRSSVSSADKQFGFFGGGKHRKKGSSSRKGKAKSNASSSLRSPTIEEGSHDGGRSVVSGGRRSGAGGDDESPGLPSHRFSSFTNSVYNNLSGNTAPGGSLFGVDITNPQPGLESLFQELGDGVSMVTKTTETTVRDRTAEDSDYLVSQVHISAGDADHRVSHSTVWQPTTRFREVVNLPPSAETANQKNREPDDARPLPPPFAELPPIAESLSRKNAEHGLSAKQKGKRPIRPKLVAPAISPATVRPTDKFGAWKAPDDWAISPTESATSGPSVGDPQESSASSQTSTATLDIARVQRDLEHMLQTAPQIILARLKDELRLLGVYDPAIIQKLEPAGRYNDAQLAKMVKTAHSSVKERDMETQRWLLTALYNMESILTPEIDQANKPTTTRPSRPKLLSLFESQATTSYLAGFNISVPVYHLSPEPLAHKAYPNLHPLVCPEVSVPMLPLATDAFTSIWCTPMTSILPSADIPKLLRGIHQVLAPGGALRLVIIDPLPVPSSMGPLLQRWADESLVFNLEMHFRCTRPSRYFPVWLEEARLRGRGSVVTSTRFTAVLGDANKSGEAATPAAARTTDEERALVKKELRSVVGRLLWKEVWGGFVTADKWWWEIPEIVAECAEYKTFWEYSLITACKSFEHALLAAVGKKQAE